MKKFYMALACFCCSCFIINAQTIIQPANTTQMQTVVVKKEDATKSKSVQSRNADTKEGVDQNSQDKQLQTNSTTNTKVEVKKITIDGVEKTVITKETWNSQSERGRTYIKEHPELYYVEE